MPHLILGHTTTDSVRIWTRAIARWPVVFVEVLDAGDNVIWQSERIMTDADDFHIAIVECTGLQPGQRYRAKLHLLKTTAPDSERIRQQYCEGNFRTFTDRPFSFVFGSCNLHSMGLIARPDRAWTRISQIAKAANASFMLHCGDQIYADIPFSPKPSLSHYRNKYLDAWMDCVPTQRVLTELPHYMILDDHEIDNDFDLDGQKSMRNRESLLNVASQTYWEFQHSHNPPTPKGVFYYSFSCGGSEFFVLDTRTHRSRSARLLLDAKQEQALKDWLVEHKDRMKFLVSSVPFVSVARRGRDDKWNGQHYLEQRNRILQHIRQHAIRHLVFLTGDMHNSLHSTLELDGTELRIHELMSSPINQITPDKAAGERYVLNNTEVAGGMTLKSQVDPASYYGRSNIMVVRVDGYQVRYEIHRTTGPETGPTGSFFA